MILTAAMAIAAPIKAPMETIGIPSTAPVNPARTVAAAPHEAPLAVPSVKGSAIGLRKRAWNTIPQRARPEPARNAARMRGTRICQKIS